MRLTHRDWRAALDFTRAAHACGDLDAFARQILGGLPKLVGVDVIAYNEYNLAKERIHYSTQPDEPEFQKYQGVLGRHLAEHPIVTHYGRTRDGRAFRISDFLTLSQFHRRGVYNEFFRRFDVNYQMIAHLPSPPNLTIAMSLNRSRRDFTERDRLLCYGKLGVENRTAAAACAHQAAGVTRGPDGRFTA